MSTMDRSRLEELLLRTDASLSEFTAIFKNFPESPVTARPASRSWRPTLDVPITEPDIAAGVEAHRNLSRLLSDTEECFDSPDARELWQGFPLRPYRLQYWTAGMQNESRESWLAALKDHRRRLESELAKHLPPVTPETGEIRHAPKAVQRSSARMSPQKTQRGGTVPDGLPARLDLAKGLKSLARLAEEMELDPKTLRKLRTSGARVDGSSIDAAMDFLDKAKKSSRVISTTE